MRLSGSCVQRANHYWYRAARVWLRRALTGLLLVLVLPPVASWYVAQQTQPYTRTNPEQVPAAPVGIVLGAGVRADGTPSRMLADRLRVAAHLYRTGQVSSLLLTGDGVHPTYNEVAGMQTFLVQQGVPRAALTLDRYGVSTYASCHRAAAIYKIARAVVVSQAFHVPRAVYLCRQQGIAVYGVGTADWGSYSPVTMTFYSVRESLATLKALWQVHVSRPSVVDGQLAGAS